MNRHDLDLHAAALARRQHGAFSLGQLLDGGASYDAIQARTGDGRFLVLDTGVYAHPALPGSWLRQAKAAELRFPEGAISGRAAAVLHQLGALRPGALEVTVPRGGGRTCRLARVRHRTVPTAVVDGIRVVTVEQAIADLASSGDRTALEGVVEDALWRELVTIECLTERRVRMSATRIKGAALLGTVLDEQATGAAPPATALERALYAVLDEGSLPEYVRQAPFPWWPWAPQRVDAYVPAWGRIIEADGRRWHTRRADFERDKWRDHLAQAHGVEVTRFSYGQLVRDPGYARSLLLEIGLHHEAA
jgi:hypothetical protein